MMPLPPLFCLWLLLLVLFVIVEAARARRIGE
jgi:hypothetical protein